MKILDYESHCIKKEYNNGYQTLFLKLPDDNNKGNAVLVASHEKIIACLNVFNYFILIGKKTCFEGYLTSEGNIVYSFPDSEAQLSVEGVLISLWIPVLPPNRFFLENSEQIKKINFELNRLFFDIKFLFNTAAVRTQGSILLVNSQ